MTPPEPARALAARTASGVVPQVAGLSLTSGSHSARYSLMASSERFLRIQTSTMLSSRQKGSPLMSAPASVASPSMSGQKAKSRRVMAATAV